MLTDQPSHSSKIPDRELSYSNNFTDIDKVPLSLMEQFTAHWKLMSDRKRARHDVDISKIIYGQLFTILAVGLASLFIDARRESLLLVGSALIVYPSLADVLVSNAATLSAGLHHEIGQQQRKFWFTLNRIGRTVAISTLACVLVGVLAGLLGLWLFSASFFVTLKMAILAGFLAGIAGLPVLAAVTLLARKFSANPDDVTPPIDNTLFNILVIVMISVASRILA